MGRTGSVASLFAFFFSSFFSPFSCRVPGALAGVRVRQDDPVDGGEAEAGDAVIAAWQKKSGCEGRCRGTGTRVVFFHVCLALF